MKKYSLLTVLNYRILIILIETLLVYFLYYKYNFKLSVDFTILSIAIVFPIVFSITSAYQKRQDALFTFNILRNKMIELSNIYFSVEGTTKGDYQKLFSALSNIQSLVIKHLIQDTRDGISEIRKSRKDIFFRIDNDKQHYNEREKDSLIRVKNELFQSIEKLFSIKHHPTPKSLRKYCLVFIYLSPFIYNGQILFVNSIDTGLKNIVSLVISSLIGFVLMALYNVQEHIENPFDGKGMDDLDFQAIQMNEYEQLG